MNSIPPNLQTTTEATFLLPGPAGDLEVLLSPTPQSPQSPPTIALICHPHPLHGGTMTNKVVTTLAKTFSELNTQTLRFNFRGVGKSTGTYAQGEGELQDLYAVLAWVKDLVPEAKLWLAGFSFGAYIAIRAAAEKELAGLVSIAPPVNHFAFKDPIQITCPWIVVQGEQDEVVPTSQVLDWLATLNPSPTLIRFPNAGHFFHGGLTELRQSLVKALQPFFHLST